MRRVPDKVRLLHGPYEPLPLRKGERASCLYRDADVVITGRSGGRISGGAFGGIPARAQPIPPPRGEPMLPQKTLPQRENELQALLATPAGREELQRLVSRYQAASGRLRPGKTSAITSILVHERGPGLLSS